MLLHLDEKVRARSFRYGNKENTFLSCSETNLTALQREIPKMVVLSPASALDSPKETSGIPMPESPLRSSIWVTWDRPGGSCARAGRGPTGPTSGLWMKTETRPLISLFFVIMLEEMTLR